MNRNNIFKIIAAALLLSQAAGYAAQPPAPPRAGQADNAVQDPLAAAEQEALQEALRVSQEEEERRRALQRHQRPEVKFVGFISDNFRAIPGTIVTSANSAYSTLCAIPDAITARVGPLLPSRHDASVFATGIAATLGMLFVKSLLSGKNNPR